MAAPTPALSVEPQYLARHSSRPLLVPQSVADLGLPVRALTPHAQADPRVALLDVLADLAVATPSRLSGVQVVVGELAAADRLAAAWATTCAEDDGVIVRELAGESPEQLALRARDTAASRGGALVVVDAGTTRASARRAGRQLAGLDACAVVAVVDARWDPAITREWLAALGGHGRGVDQLAAHGVLESPTPLRLLEVGPQVTWLDDQPATLGSWAAPCLDRWR